MTTTYSLRFEQFMERIPRLSFLSDKDRYNFSRIESLKGRYGRNPLQLDFETKSFQDKSIEFFREEFEQVRGKYLYLLDELVETWDFDDMMRELRMCEAAIFVDVDKLMERMTDEQVERFVRVIEDLVLADKQVIAFGDSKTFAFHFCKPGYWMVGDWSYLEDLHKRRNMVQ